MLVELQYRRLFETAPDGILILDAASGKIVESNAFFRELLGCTDSELVGKQLWETEFFKDVIDSKKAFLKLQDKGQVRYKDLCLQTKAGLSIEVELIITTYLVEEKKMIQCNIRDITSRKKEEDAKKIRTEELERLSKLQNETKRAMLNIMEDLESAKTLLEVEKIKDEAILASIGEGLVAVDNDRKVLIMNKAAETMLGWKIEDMIGREITNLPLQNEKGDLLPTNRRPTFEAIATGKTVKGTYYFERKDKSKFPIAIIVTPIKMGGKIIGALDVFRDVTAETEIDRAKSEFVSLASHQLRTPLGIVKWYLEALESEKYLIQAPVLIRKYFGEIYKNNERVLSLVGDLLSVSRIDQGRVKNVAKPVDLVQAISETVEQMQIVAEKRKVGLRLILGTEKIPVVNIDGLRFREVMENLIGNAIWYTQSLGSVNVNVEAKGTNLVIEVCDTGIGISQGDQKKLFTKFFRSEKAVGYNPEGSGLGLYVVKAYVEGWGGEITVESSVGKGSKFTISIPMKGGGEK